MGARSNNRRLVSPTGRPVVLRGAQPSAAIQAKYQKRLDAMIDAMQRSLVRWITAAWRAKPPELAQDETSRDKAKGKSPAMNLRDEMDRLTAQWQAQFDEGAEELGRYFATASMDRTDAQLKKALADAGFTIEFKMTASANDALQATIGEQVGLIKSIASEHLSDVQGMVMRAVQSGGDLGTLAKGLEDRYGVTKRRAALIARDQTSKANATIDRARKMELGITQAKWRHSAGERNPRPDHVKANGEIYDVAKGCLISGEYIQPGELINCKCFSQAIIPGL